jgi:hypothetical protein
MLKKESFGDPFLDCTGSVQFCIHMFLSVEPFKPHWGTAAHQAQLC